MPATVGVSVFVLFLAGWRLVLGPGKWAEAAASSAVTGTLGGTLAYYVLRLLEGLAQGR